MLSPALYLLQFVVERSLGCFVLVCLEFFESLILLEGRDVFSQFIDKGCGSMFQQIVDDDQHIQIFAGLVKVVFEDSDSLDAYVHNFLEGFEVICHISKFVEFGCGDYLFLGLEDLVEQLLRGRSLIDDDILGGLPDGGCCLLKPHVRL